MGELLYFSRDYVRYIQPHHSHLAKQEKRIEWREGKKRKLSRIEKQQLGYSEMERTVLSLPGKGAIVSLKRTCNVMHG